MSNYRKSLEAAGHDIIAFESFGDYQGMWYAMLSSGYVILGRFGSCSECDAFKSEFGYFFDDEEPTFEELKKFGERYEAYTFDEAYAEAKARGEYDYDSGKVVLDWLTENRPQVLTA